MVIVNDTHTTTLTFIASTPSKLTNSTRTFHHITSEWMLGQVVDDSLTLKVSKQ